jgi:hypothetical protein
MMPNIMSLMISMMMMMMIIIIIIITTRRMPSITIPRLTIPNDDARWS